MLAQKLLGTAQFGGTAVLYMLIALSVLSIGVIIERWLYFRRHRTDASTLGKAMLQRLRAGDRPGAIEALNKSDSVEARVLAEALAWYDDGPEALEQILSTSLKEKRKEFEAGLTFLGTLGNNAPFIGLFGTVLGVVTAFRELGATTNGAGGGMGNVMSGIAEALVATAIGILVALPAVVAYNIFQTKVNDVEQNVASMGGLVLAQMKSTRQPAVRGAAAVAIIEPKVESTFELKVGHVGAAHENGAGPVAVAVDSPVTGASV